VAEAGWPNLPLAVVWLGRPRWPWVAYRCPHTGCRTTAALPRPSRRYCCLCLAWLRTVAAAASLLYSARVGSLLLCGVIASVSVFDDRQPVTGVPATVFDGLRRMQNSTVNAETTIYTGSVRRNSVPTSSLGGKYIVPCT
jgi:hypothetical protein